MDPIAGLARRIKRVEKLAFRAATQPQLAYSSIEDGAIQSVEDGALKAIIGKQFDGTQAIAIVNGPPPPRPSIPGAEAALEGAVISWDGTFEGGTIVPMDFARVEVHVSTDPDFTAEFASTLKATFETPRGGHVFVSLVPATYYVKLVARNSSGGRSLVSPSATVVPTAISDLVVGVGSDNEPPASSPTPTVDDGIGAIIVTWDKVDNADPVTYDVHASATAGFTVDDTNLIGSTPGTGPLFIRSLKDGTKVVAGTPYHVRLVARDIDGAAPPSAEASGTPGQIQSTDVATGSITAVKIPDGAINAAKIANEAVTTSKIALDAITNDLIAAGAITAVEIADGSVTAAEIADETITAAKIAADAITSSELAPNAVTATEISDGAVTTPKLVANAVTAGKVAAGAITTEKLTIGSMGDNMVPNGNMEDVNTTDPTIPARFTRWADNGGVTYSMVDGAASGTRALSMQKVNDGFAAVRTALLPVVAGRTYYVSAQRKTVGGNTLHIHRVTGIAADQVTETGLILNDWTFVTSTTWEDRDGTITIPGGTAFVYVEHFHYTPSSDAGATLVIDDVRMRPVVIAAQIANGAIIADKIAAGAVTAGKIAADAVTANEIAANSITSSEIAADAVTAVKILAGAVTTGKIAADAVTANEIAAGAVTAEAILAGAVTTEALEAGAVVADKIESNAVTSDKINANAVTAGKILAGSITADKIFANSVTTEKLDTGAVTSDKIFSNAVIAEKIKSGAVTADKLEATLLLATTIQVGSPNFTINPTTGILILLPNGGKISMPATGSNAEFRKVILQATDLLVEDNFELRGASNRISGTLKMSTGVDTPTTGPSLSSGWAAASVGPFIGSSSYRGLHDGGTVWLTAASGGTLPSSAAAIIQISKTTGASGTLRTAVDLGLDNTTQQILDYTRLGTSNYILVGPYAGSSKDTVVRVYNNSWVLTAEWKVPTVGGRSASVISNDGTALFLGYRSTTGGDNSVQVLQVAASGTAARTQLIPNPSFEVDASNWVVGALTGLTRSNTVGGQVGLYAGRIESKPTRTNIMPSPLAYGYSPAGLWTAGGGADGGSFWSGTYWNTSTSTSTSSFTFYTNSPILNVTAGVAHTVAFDLVSSSGINAFGCLVRWFDAGGATIQQTDFTASTAAVRKVWNIGAAPAGAVTMQIYPHATKGPSGINVPGQFNIKDVSVSATSEGDSSIIPTTDPYAYWTGTAGNSPTVSHPPVDVSVSTPMMSATAAKDYVASIYSRASLASNIQVGINWYDASNTFLGGDNSAMTAESTSAFVRTSRSATAPAGTTKASVTIFAPALARGDYHYFDAAMFEQASVLGAYFDGSSAAAGKLYTWLGTANASASEETVATTLFTTATSGTPISGTPTNMWVGTADLGSKHFAIQSSAGIGLWTAAGARGSTQTDREWGLVGASPTIGLNWDGTNFRALTYLAGGAGSFTNSIYTLGTAGIVARAISARYSQYDAVAPDFHETAWSNPTAFTLPPRQVLVVTTPSPQGTGAADEPNRIRHYIQINGGSYYRQADVTATPWSATYDAIPTTGATSTSLPDFTGLGNPGVIQSAKLDSDGLPLWMLRGDGLIHMFPGEVRGLAGIKIPLGALKCDGTSYLRSIYPQLFTAITFFKTGSNGASSNVISMADTSDLAIGMQVEAAGIPAGATITAITANTSITISATSGTVANAAGTSYRIIPHGAADATHFNVPDYRGCTLVGADGTPEFAGVGTKYGEKKHIIITSEMPSHTHNNPDHGHGILSGSSGLGAVVGSASARFQTVASGGGFAPTNQVFNTTVTGGATVSSPVGGDQGHNNIQPSASVNWIIAW